MLYVPRGALGVELWPFLWKSYFARSRFEIVFFNIFVFLVFKACFKARGQSRNTRLDETRPVMCCTSPEVPSASSYGHFFGRVFFVARSRFETVCNIFEK